MEKYKEDRNKNEIKFKYEKYKYKCSYFNCYFYNKWYGDPCWYHDADADAEDGADNNNDASAAADDDAADTAADGDADADTAAADDADDDEMSVGGVRWKDRLIPRDQKSCSERRFENGFYTTGHKYEKYKHNKYKYEKTNSKSFFPDKDHQRKYVDGSF